MIETFESGGCIADGESIESFAYEPLNPNWCCSGRYRFFHPDVLYHGKCVFVNKIIFLYKNEILLFQ